MAGSQRRPGALRPGMAAALLLTSLYCTTARADLSDTFHPFASVSYSYDDNLLRLPAAPAGTDQSLSDSYKQAIVGLEFERPVGRQMFTGSIKDSKVTFDRFSELNYTGKDYQATWIWQLGNHWHGRLGGLYSQTLAPFNDFHSNELNLRVQTTEFFEANWLFHPSWQVRGRLNRDKYNYDLSSQDYLNRKEDSVEVGFDFLAASGSTIGLQARQLKGKYPTPIFLGAFFLDQSYTQDELELKTLWLATPLTRVQLLIGRVRREHVESAGRDASGTNGRMIATWLATPNVTLTGQAWREFTPYEGSAASYTLNNGASIDGQWNVTAKVQATLSYKYYTRDFAGYSQLVATQFGTKDTTHTGTLGVTYQATRQIQLGATVFQDDRTAETPFSTSYRAKGASVSANLQF